MEEEDVLNRFLNNKGYLSNGAGKLAKRWKVSKSAIRIARAKCRLIIEQEKENFVKNNKKFKRLFFDIETSYNLIADFSCGWNKNIHPGQILKERAIICICWKWEHENNIHYLKWDNNQSDKKMLKEFITEIETADEVIGHNGDRFDIKWLRTRCMLHNIQFPVNIKSLDTLKKVKQSFYFNSNKLDYLGKVMGLGGKQEHEGLDLWIKICEHKDNKAMDDMIRYCKRDVVLLEDVYHKIKSYTTPNAHMGMFKNNSKLTCPSCGNEDISYKKTTFTRAGTIQRICICDKCSTDFKISNAVWIKYLKT